MTTYDETMHKRISCFMCKHKHYIDDNTVIETHEYDDGEVWYTYNAKCPKCGYELFYKGETKRDYKTLEKKQ